MNQIFSLILYFSIFSGSSLLMHYGIKRNLKFFIILSLIIPATLAAVRYGVGTDYFNYINIINSFKDVTTSQFLANNINIIEPGFYALIKTAQVTSHTYIALFGISSFFTLCFFYLGLKKLNIRHQSLVYFLFLLTIFPFTLNAVRQGIALSISFFAISFLIKKQQMPFYIMLGIACLFHYSAIILLFTPLIFKLILKEAENTKTKTIIFRTTIMILAITLLLPIVFNNLYKFGIFDKYSEYGSILPATNNFAYYLKAILLIISLFVFIHLRKRVPDLTKYFVLSGIGLAVAYSGFISPAYNRLTVFYEPFLLICVCYSMDLFVDKLGKVFAYISIYSYGLIYFYISYYVLKLANIIPYNIIPRNLL